MYNKFPLNQYFPLGNTSLMPVGQTNQDSVIFHANNLLPQKIKIYISSRPLLLVEYKRIYVAMEESFSNLILWPPRVGRCIWSAITSARRNAFRRLGALELLINFFFSTPRKETTIPFQPSWRKS